MYEVILFSLTLFGSGVVFVAVGLPLFIQRVPPNYWYGCRTTKALSDDKIWYAVNRVTGKSMMVGGAIMMFNAAGMLAFRGMITAGLAAAILIASLVAATVFMIVESARAQRRY